MLKVGFSSGADVCNIVRRGDMEDILEFSLLRDPLSEAVGLGEPGDRLVRKRINLCAQYLIFITCVMSAVELYAFTEWIIVVNRSLDWWLEASRNALNLSLTVPLQLRRVLSC